MNILDYPEHPYWHVRDAVLSNPDITELSLSYYKYVPQTINDERKIFSISRNDFIDEILVKDFISNAPKGMEVAIHSNIELSNHDTAHFPMVDMSTASSVQLSKLAPFIGEELFKTMKWYKSGRSYHGYAGKLISDREWVALMGRLLLANQKGMPATVDSRWVGHRLIAGYAALRWSKNTDHYLQVPTSAKLLVK
ncbi:primase 1D-like protein [Halomonas sp. BC04]|uniref:primase 1D-like protein n=1 Tax=Halomonas sp. BC04 TaxID=1403540 RepID=UPI0012DE3C21|nr:hypothetical protein [Halomonas sp. BC04]